MSVVMTAAAIGRRIHDVPVLIVDANSSNRLLLSEMVCSLNMKPVTVADTGLALSIARHVGEMGNPFQLVIIDGEHPAVEEEGFTEKIHQQIGIENIRIILIHGKNSQMLENSEMRIMNVRRPIDIPVLKEIVSQVFQQWPMKFDEARIW